MFQTIYKVRVIEDGKVVLKRKFLLKDRFVNFVKEKSKPGRRLSIDTTRNFVLETFQNTAYTLLPHTPWVNAPKPIKLCYIHHSVTTQLPVTATVEQEREQMEILDAIAHGRGFSGGISYCWVVFPSGRCWEGRGFGVVEAGTLGHNTDGDSIVLAGNYSAFKMSEEQKAALPKLINRAQRDGFFVKSGLSVIGHRNAGGDPTSCPGNNVTDGYLADLQKSVN